MSAYVVDDETISRVVSFLYLGQQANSHYWPTQELSEAGYNLINDHEDDRLALDMFNLNVQAVNERYGAGEAEKFRPLNFRYKFTLNVNPVQAYKSLQCWLYQCTEGIVPDTDLYNLMSEVKNRIAIEIVENLPAYEKAEWA